MTITSSFPFLAPLVATVRPYRRACLVTALMVVVLAVVLVALHSLLQEVSYAQMVDAIRLTPGTGLILALLATVASYVFLMGYDLSSLRYVGARVPGRVLAFTSFVAYALGNTVGLGVLTGGAVRMRMYAAAGVPPAQVGRAIAFNVAAFGVGLGTVSAVGLLFAAGQVAPVLHLSPLLLQLGALLVLALVAAFLLACSLRRELRIGRFRLLLPSASLAAGQLLISTLEIVTAALVLWWLLPHAGLDFSRFLACYAIGLTAGVISHVPGGLGVFEAVMLAGMNGVVPREQLVAALVLYRGIYFLLPLLVSLLLLAGFEMRRGIGAPVVRAAARLTPVFLATALFVVAVMLLLSGALPATDEATALLSLSVPLPLVEVSHLASSLAGLLLLFVVRGVLHRLDAAWWAALVLSGVAAVLSLPKGLSLVEMTLLGFVFLMLLVSRPEFDRRASLFAQRFTPEWWLLIASVLALTLWVLFFAYRDVEYAHQLWWQFEFDAHAPRSLRAVLAIILAGAGIAFWQMFRPSPVPLALPDNTDLERAAQIVQTQPSAEAGLALMGDKHFLFSQSGRAFLMYGVRGRSLVALFDPVGPLSEWQELIWRFKEMADERGARAAFYQVRPQHLPLYLDAGFRAYKLGEYAWVSLVDFTLKGAQRANLRHGCSRAERQGLRVEVVPAEQAPALLPQLLAVSDAWLAAGKLGEKGFSLGGFDPAYVVRHPLALVWQEQRLVAFATLLESGGDEASVDLMRYVPGAPAGTMEYLFASIMQHFQARGYQRFGLGMAPLSGMADHPLAPPWHRFARLLFAYGEHFYKFQGLRNFKDKFAPQWEARYLATAGSVGALKTLVDIAALISGRRREVSA